MPTIAEYNDDLFLMAWGRVMANFANLPRLLQAELDPFREKIMSAAKHGHPCINLAAQINDIASRHAFARLLPFDLDSDLPNAFPELSDDELIERLKSVTEHNAVTGFHRDPLASVVMGAELGRRRRVSGAAAQS